jgi:hypothetical protein
VFHFHKALRALQHHLRDLHVSLHAFVEVRVINLTIHLPLQVRHFFRPFVHQKQDEHNVRMIYADRFRDFLEQDRLAHSRRRNDETALPAPEWR